MTENEMIQQFLDRKINVWVPNKKVMEEFSDLLKPYNKDLGDSPLGYVSSHVMVLVDWDTRVKRSADEFPNPPMFYRNLPVYVYRGNPENTFQC